MRALVPTVTVALLAACAASAPTFRPVQSEHSARIAPARQRELWSMVKQDCGSCHGLLMKGGLGAPLPRERLAALPRPALAAVILEGVPGTAMPRWRGLITEEEALWIAAGLQQGAFE